MGKASPSNCSDDETEGGTKGMRFASKSSPPVSRVSKKAIIFRIRFNFY
jgi:hypothetical protein